MMGFLDSITGFVKQTFSPNKDLPTLQENTSGTLAFKTKEEAVMFVVKEFERRQKERRPVELQWNLNMNFLMGNQYCDINLSSFKLEQIAKFYDWEEREIFNQIAPIYETRLAALKKVKPLPLVRPATAEMRDLATAKTSTYVEKGLERKETMDEKRSQMTAWAEICGSCFLKHVWNPNDGRLIGELDGQGVYEGDINKIVVPAFEIFPPNSFAHGVEALTDIIHAKAYHIDEIENIWGVKLKGKKIDVFTLSQTSVGSGGLGLSSTSYKIIPTQVENQEIVMEFTSLPCKKFPKGIIMVVAGNDLLEYKEMTFQIGENRKPGLPFEMQGCIDNPGQFWPSSVIERLIPIQRAYNAVKNRKHEALNRKALGVLDIEDDGMIDIENLEQEGLYPGKILLRGRGTRAAQFLRSGDSTVDFDNEEMRLEHMFERISGVSAFSSSSAVPTGVESGEAMEKIREQDNSRLALTAENINNAAIRSFKIDLRLYKQFAPDGTRLLRYVGDNNDVLLVEWQASELQSEDIVVEKEDALSQTPAQRRQTAIELLQYGLLRDNVDAKIRTKFLEIFEFGNWEDVDDVEELHRSKAMRENKAFEKGAFMPPDTYDDHAIHVNEHNRYRLDIKFDQIKVMYPQIAQAIDQHVQLHEQLMMMKIQQAMMLQGAQQPQGKEKSPPPQ